MATTKKIPTTSDIYLEINGKRVAVVQSYQVRAERSAKPILAFGQEEPVATIRGAAKYTLELTRIYATDAAIRDGLDFYALTDFNLVVRKPDRSVIFTGCQWAQLEEGAEVGGTVLERVTVTASHRMEKPA